MAPMYTKDGNYIGMIRVDMYTESLHMYKKDVLALLSMLLLIPTIVLISLFINYHNGYKKEMKTTLYKDKLTGLYNRYYYESYISKIVRKLRKTNGNLSVMMLDIDDFKMYNDYYGHVNGDDVLKVVAKEFSEEIEKFRGCSGRYGGEEMIGILPNITISEGEIICDRICKAFKKVEG
jgi:PleD family two-component response regulator